MNKKISQYLFVIVELAKREIKRQHSEAKLGALWNVINPLLFMIVMSALYGTIFKHDIENFQVYFMIGFVFYTLYRTATTHAMDALVSNKMFLVRTTLPKNVFILEKIVYALIDFMYSLIALAILMCFFRIRITPMILFFIPDLILTLFIVTGLGKILSIINVYFADIRYLYSVFMTLVLFGSAVFYPADRLTGIMRTILEINPVYLSLTIARECILYSRIPGGKYWIYLLVWSIISYTIGTAIFEKKSADIIQYL